MESMIVASFSVAETALKGAKSCNPKPGRRFSLIRADAHASQTGHSRSLVACAHVNLGHAVGITGQTHFVACQFRHRQARASLRQKTFCWHCLKPGVPDAGGSVVVQ